MPAVIFPYGTDIDLAGTAAEPGPDVTGLEVGAVVVAMLPVDSAGAAAEYVLAAAGAPDGAPA
ncbi:NADP-dependent oxidoreductase, partial [Streptomyces sp. NPDC057148]